MNDEEIEKFEQALRRAHPAPVPSALHERIAQAMASGEESGIPDNVIDATGAFQWFRPLATAAAVALSALILIFLVQPRDQSGMKGARNEKAPSKPDSVEITGAWQPVKAGHVIEDARDEGIIISDESGVPSRRIRYQFTDRYRWENPENGASIEFRIPQESHYVVPIQTD